MSGNKMSGDNRFEIIHKVKEHLVKHTNIETQPEEMAVVNSIFVPALAVRVFGHVKE